jgi:hypothetical protein
MSSEKLTEPPAEAAWGAASRKTKKEISFVAMDPPGASFEVAGLVPFLSPLAMAYHGCHPVHAWP